MISDDIHFLLRSASIYPGILFAVIEVESLSAADLTTMF